METTFNHNELSMLRIACSVAIREFQTPEMEGKYGPTAAAQAIATFRSLEYKIEQITLSL